MKLFTSIKSLHEKLKVWGVPGVLNFFRRNFAGIIQRKKLKALARKSKFKTPEKGITIIADLTAQVSLSKTMRDFILLLKEAGIPHQTYDTCLKPQIPQEDVSDIVTPPGEFDLGRFSHIIMMYRSPLPPDILPQCKRIRLAFYDSAHGIHETLPFLKESGDDIAAMSDFNYQYFKKEFPDQNVYKITYPFRFKSEKATPRNILRKKYGMEESDFIVFFNFDFGSYYRKNIPAALRAFAKAFKGDHSAKLLFKTKGAKANPKQVQEMMSEVHALNIGAQFIHISQYLPRADIDGLTDACDVYLSLHKSEGFGIGMAEAMSQKKPVVATNWSANTEFCHDETAWCIPYKMTDILSHEYPVSMKEWADADIEAAADALREIRNNPKIAEERAKNGAAFMQSHFSTEKFKADIENILRRGNHHNTRPV